MDEAEAQGIVAEFLEEWKIADMNDEVPMDKFFSNAISPLGIAVETMNPKVVSALLKLGVDPSKAAGEDPEGLTPLARASEWTGPQRAQLVLVKGEYPNITTHPDAIEIVNMLVGAKADINDTGKGEHDGMTALVLAGGNTPITRILLEAKADVNAFGGFSQQTALMKTACCGVNILDHVECMKLLVEAKADVETKDNRDFGVLKAMKFGQGDQDGIKQAYLESAGAVYG